MSANPEAFDWVRQAAYDHVRRHGKDRLKIHTRCEQAMVEWMSEHGYELSRSEAASIVEAVTDWVFARYKPPRRQAERSREERAAMVMMAPFALEQSGELFGSPSIRGAAGVIGQSKSTVARHLQQHGIHPRRDKVKSRLSPQGRRLIEILEATLPRDGGAVFRLDALCAAFYERRVASEQNAVRSTKSTRRKKIREHAEEVVSAKLGFHILFKDDVVAVLRGRLFPAPKDAAIWIDEERRVRGIYQFRLPVDRSDLFWEDRWVKDVIDVMKLIRDYDDVRSVTQLEPFLRLDRTLLDPTPIYLWIQRAINGWEDFAVDLWGYAEIIDDPTVRRAVAHIGQTIAELNLLISQRWLPQDVYFDQINARISFMKHAAAVAPKSCARLRFLRHQILAGSRLEHHEMMVLLNNYAQQEQEGAWAAPTEKELEKYLPVKRSESPND